MSDAAPKRRSGLFPVFLLLATIALTVLVVLLTGELRRTRAQLEAAEQALARERTRDSLAVGDEVGPLTLTGPDGGVRTIDFRAGRATLVFMISGHCPYCDQTIPVWERLLKQTETGPTSPIAIVCVQSDARTVADLKPLAGPLTPFMPQAGVTTWLSRIPISPGVVLVGADGVVKRTWFGVPSDRDEAQLGAVLLGGDPNK
jgi:thiol-disulfide isomerase/thioredoxin